MPGRASSSLLTMLQGGLTLLACWLSLVLFWKHYVCLLLLISWALVVLRFQRCSFCVRLVLGKGLALNLLFLRKKNQTSYSHVTCSMLDRALKFGVVADFWVSCLERLSKLILFLIHRIRKSFYLLKLSRKPQRERRGRHRRGTPGPTNNSTHDALCTERRVYVQIYTLYIQKSIQKTKLKTHSWRHTLIAGSGCSSPAPPL